MDFLQGKLIFNIQSWFCDTSSRYGVIPSRYVFINVFRVCSELKAFTVVAPSFQCFACSYLSIVQMLLTIKVALFVSMHFAVCLIEHAFGLVGNWLYRCSEPKKKSLTCPYVLTFIMIHSI